MKYRCTYLISLFFILSLNKVIGQACTTLGQTPATAFPVCATSVFRQATVPLCVNTPNVFVPGCGDGYPDKNPFFYKFTCYVAGTLGFTITPLGADEDYDWQLFDVTGKNPNDIFTDNSLVVTGNWSGTYGATGASATGVNNLQCGSIPTDNAPTFSAMPTLTVAHEYILLISHFSDTQSGYDLEFSGGTAVLKDPAIPAMASIRPECDGMVLNVKLNKKILCNSLSLNGSEFSLVPNNATVISAQASSCATGFDFDSVVIKLSNKLPNGNYQLVINNGSDRNTLLDICGNEVNRGNSVPFYYASPDPIYADSIAKPRCTPDSVRIYFPKKIACNTIAPNGSEFSVSGPTAVQVVGATGNCVDNKTPYVVVKFAAPIYTEGNYTLTLKPGSDGTILLDECAVELPVQNVNFITADTVNADFTYTSKLGCRSDTLTFSHNGANKVNNWNWRFNGGAAITTQSHTIVWSASSTNTVSLSVGNGTCIDSTTSTIILDNEVKALFDMKDVTCPEDAVLVLNNSTGDIDEWKWQYDVLGSSTVENPPPFLFPTLNNEAYYTVKLTARNNTLNCSDSIRKRITVLDFCLIEVPTAFTPNNDGLNDFFQPHNALKADQYSFKVFNRWGQLVFQSNNWRDKWDGRINGNLQTTGVYAWVLSYINPETKQRVMKKGTLTLIR
jgi:gliding motility-associated-like protein